MLSEVMLIDDESQRQILLDEEVKILQKAAYSGDDDCIRAILSRGNISVNANTLDSNSALHCACLAGNASTARLLIEAGAQVNARNIDGATPLCEASCCGSNECILLLLKHGATVNPNLVLSSPLHEAVLRDKWECAEILLHFGANTESMDCHYGTALHIAAWKDHINSAQVLLRNGANVSATKTLESALHFAARTRSERFITLLLDYGADIYARDNHGRKAIDLVTSVHPIRQLLAFYERNPRNLSHFCRLCIRQTIPRYKSIKIKQLPLPKKLLDYLDFRDNNIS
ncbi:ankyrin repeat and SOCS box protein 5-like [Tubulanus polymorphus]|uniref:ankyrin repeat and SOCS box protein 5-like n=1 Tax=Tubulanus polymorphus TaxID=672921 RepID=UPI003DA5184E